MTARLPDPDSSLALLVGVSRYASGDIPDLPAVANNVATLNELFADPAVSAFADDACVVVRDPGYPHELGIALERAAKRADDTLVVYFAGHGMLDNDGDLHLGLAGTDPDHIASTAYPVRALRRVLAGAKARNRVLILDCCFSGRAINAMGSDSSLVMGQVEVSGTYTIASSPANNTSIAPRGARYTTFTGELIELLRHGSPAVSELLSLDEIYYLMLRSLSARGLPEPQRAGTGLSDRLALVRNAGHRPTRPAAQAPVQPAAPVRERIVPRQPTEESASPTLEFHQAMVEGYMRAKKELGYNATQFIRMVSEKGGLDAAKRLLASPRVSDGFTTLWERGRLDLAVEAVVSQDRFASLFTDEERRIARERLEAYGYDVSRSAASGTSVPAAATPATTSRVPAAQAPRGGAATEAPPPVARSAEQERATDRDLASQIIAHVQAREYADARRLILSATGGTRRRSLTQLLEPRSVAALLGDASDREAYEILADISADRAGRILVYLPDRRVADAFAPMSPRWSASALASLPAHHARAIAQLITPELRTRIREELPEPTATRLFG